MYIEISHLVGVFANKALILSLAIESSSSSIGLGVVLGVVPLLLGGAWLSELWEEM